MSKLRWSLQSNAYWESFFGYKPDWIKYLDSVTRLGSNWITHWKYWTGLGSQKSSIHSTLAHIPFVVNRAFSAMPAERLQQISGRIVSLQPDTDIQKRLLNGNRVWIRISETLFLIFRGFWLLEKVAHCTIIHFRCHDSKSVYGAITIP